MTEEQGIELSAECDQWGRIHVIDRHSNREVLNVMEFDQNASDHPDSLQWIRIKVQTRPSREA